MAPPLSFSPHYLFVDERVADVPPKKVCVDSTGCCGTSCWPEESFTGPLSRAWRSAPDSTPSEPLPELLPELPVAPEARAGAFPLATVGNCIPLPA